jgi:hypothetical protein
MKYRFAGLNIMKFEFSRHILEENDVEYNTGVPPYLRAPRSKIYCDYVKPQIIPKTIFVQHTYIW